VEWLASGTGMVAALMVSINAGARVTGWGFAVFVLSSLAWITAAWIEGEPALGSQNLVLFGINCLGVYRWLLRGGRSGPS